jgi:hypothetical protein
VSVLFSILQKFGFLFQYALKEFPSGRFMFLNRTVWLLNHRLDYRVDWFNLHSFLLPPSISKLISLFKFSLPSVT